MYVSTCIHASVLTSLHVVEQYTCRFTIHVIIGTCIMDTSEQQSTPDTCTSDKWEKQTDSEFVNHVHVPY